VDQVKAPSALVGIAGALAGGYTTRFIPDFGDQDRFAGEQPDPDYGNPPVEGGGRIDRVGGKLADH
jgi:hypothetical protein